MASQLSAEIFPTSTASQYHNHHNHHQPMRAATPLTKVSVPKAEVSRSTPRISTKAGGVTAHLRRETSKSSHMSRKWCIIISLLYHYRNPKSGHEGDAKNIPGGEEEAKHGRHNDKRPWNQQSLSRSSFQTHNMNVNIPVGRTDGHECRAGCSQGQGEGCHHQGAV